MGTHHRAMERHLPYGITQCSATRHRPCRSVLDLPTPDGWKAELTLVLVIYQDGLPVRRQSPIQVVITWLLTFQPLSENSRINFLPPKPLNLYKFSMKMWTSASPGCCMIWSGLHQGVIGEAIDHVAWTAARLCENWWTRLQTLARIIWTLLDSYLMRQSGLYVKTSYLTL